MRTQSLLAGFALVAFPVVATWFGLGRLFDETTFLDALGSIWHAITTPFRGR